ncbi:MAG: C25 family cysteine peptidase [Candidatus Zixiibacteriota bacterium]
MKLTTIIIATILLICGLSFADQAPTITLDDSYAEFELSQRGKSDELNSLVVLGLNTTVPAKRYIIEVASEVALSDISWKIHDRVCLGSVASGEELFDIPTAESYSSYASAMAYRNTQNLASVPVLPVAVTKSGDKTIAHLCVFPITIDDDGLVYLNKSLTIFIDTTPVAPAQLIEQDDFSYEPADRLSSALTGSLQTQTDYLIVTSSDLRQSAEVLAAYKNSIGITSRVEVIDDILVAVSARDDAERLREYMKVFYAEGGRYVLLLGDETQLPVRYAYPYNVPTTPTLDQLQICDLYFADLTGNWDVDNDGVWGERYVDQADITPELMVGRLPFNTSEEAGAYIDKLIGYETNPGGGNTSYLEKTFFFSSDQMRDYTDGGQHHQIALAYPDYFVIDTINGVELSRGDDPSPTNTPADQLEGVLSDGYGIINIVAHGRNDAFGVKTAYYNEWPKSYFMADADGSAQGDLRRLTPNNMTSLYYSLACDNGGFDMDQPPFNQTLPNIVQTLLGLPDAGAIAFVANSRWGWVSSSYLLQKAYFESLFANPENPAVHALYDAKLALPYYYDQVYGLNYFGDPTLKIYTDAPSLLSVTTALADGSLAVTVASSHGKIQNCQVLVSEDGSVVFSGITDDNGTLTVDYDFVRDKEYVVAAIATGYAIGRVTFTPTLTTDVEDEIQIPTGFALTQNYPNPFNPSTTIEFALPTRSAVTLEVINILGQNVRTLLNESLSAGSHSVNWNGNDKNGAAVASGVYFYRLTTETDSAVRKMILAK